MELKKDVLYISFHKPKSLLRIEKVYAYIISRDNVEIIPMVLQ